MFCQAVLICSHTCLNDSLITNMFHVTFDEAAECVCGVSCESFDAFALYAALDVKPLLMLFARIQCEWAIRRDYS